jgi:Retrotransposon gag protein
MITMDDQMQTNGPNGNDEPLPPWLHNLVNSFTAQINSLAQQIKTIEQRTQVQSPSTDQTTPVATPESAPTPVPTPTSEGSSQWPRARLPDMKTFTGKRSEWGTWKNKMKAKLDRDRLAIGDRLDRFAYIEACLDETAAKMALAYVERARKASSEDPDKFMAYLDSIYGDTNAKEQAANKLNTMSQGKEAFTTFLPKFERTLAEAGGGEWTDEVKINTLKRMLNQELRKSLIYIPEHPKGYNEFVETMQTLASRLAAFEPRKSTVPPAPKPVADAMDWQSSVNKTQTPTNSQDGQKRAQWVSKEVLEKRKSSNLCLRCGGKGHFIPSCKLLPARPPQQDQTKVKATDVKEDDDSTVIGELGSDTESGKE